ncbi:unnamed protein product [Rotaria socialis]|uniref:Uncharacterized protein n=1 Tax=Rotaria socialis TaxID=392032 RepID=A0A820SIV6_9BILA|nr:unnamed protein product [Rotaria socialis]CAF3453472.1 unnamed protein product [Rotaria socialis]CAF4165502.1 unnamed protein product [Rotaria socialis]CAF4454859.1 unnamed protein product [Rotaria socialis]
MQHYVEKPQTNGYTKTTKMNPKKIDDKTDVSLNSSERKHHHHHHHEHSSHHHRHNSHTHRHNSHHHHRHTSHHHHHHHRRPHHHHYHHHRSPSYSDDSYDSYDYHRGHYLDHHHQSSRLPRIVTPQLPKIITPTPRNTNTSIFRDVGINTGTETKIMKDSGVTVDLVDVPNLADRRLEQIPVIRRTIIVEPYPAEPSSQIIVKPRADMIGKVRLSRNMHFDGDDATTVYPSTSFMTKKPKKKKSTIVNNNRIEDLNLNGIHGDDDDADKRNRNGKTRKTKIVAGTKIRNAFYN